MHWNSFMLLRNLVDKSQSIYRMKVRTFIGIYVHHTIGFKVRVRTTSITNTWVFNHIIHVYIIFKSVVNRKISDLGRITLLRILLGQFKKCYKSFPFFANSNDA